MVFSNPKFASSMPSHTTNRLESAGAAHIANSIFTAAQPVLRIHGLSGPRWRRNVAKGARIGPWLQASFQVLDEMSWKARRPCLYMLAGSDGGIRYVGISRNRMADRWRVSPALDADTLAQLPRRQLFHSQCWRPMEDEVTCHPQSSYEVRCIDGVSLTRLVSRLGPPVSGFAALAGDDEGVVAAVERWMCNQQTGQLVPWNKAMTRKA